MDMIANLKGQVICVYSEVLDLTTLGRPVIMRASHVEPDEHGRWWADLSPVEGPRLGPFDRRSQALEAEHRWLEIHWLSSGKQPEPKPRLAHDLEEILTASLQASLQATGFQTSEPEWGSCSTHFKGHMLSTPIGDQQC